MCMCVFIYWGVKLCYWWDHSNGECMGGHKVLILKMNFCSEFEQFSALPC